MINNFFSEALQNKSGRIATQKHPARILLDKNEQSTDVSPVFKKKLADCLLHADWNRYPAADHRHIESKIADYCGLGADNILLGSGSANIITALLNYFALQQKKIVIAQPSYSLFDYHCKTYNIPYTPWHLNDDLEFDLETLPALDKDSVLIITSPNNPVGNTIDLEPLENLLASNPDSCIILDNVYAEFCTIDYSSLINKYQNLVVLRSFSKAFPIAGLRLGYLCASAATVAVIRKLLLQFSVNPMALCFAKDILFDPQFMHESAARVREIIDEREALRNNIETIFSKDMLKVFPSEGNFLLIRIHEQQAFLDLMEDLAEAGISVLNTASFVLLEKTFRVSIGTPEENAIFFQVMKTSLESNIFTQQIMESLSAA